MTKPVSHLEWWPDPVTALALRARWLGAGWDYTLDWGDGTCEPVAWWQQPRRHLYERRGTYTISAVSSLTEMVGASITVTLRDSVAPSAEFELLGDQRTVRAVLARVDPPVSYQVDWGDGHVSRHDASDLSPTHRYRAGFGTPRIEVLDEPARRRATFTGPTIPEPPATGTRLVWEPTGPVGTGELRLTGFPPGVTVELGPAGDTPPGQVTVHDDGTADRRYVLFEPHNAVMDDWRSIRVGWVDPETGTPRHAWQPVQICEWAGGPRRPPSGCCWEPYPTEDRAPRNPFNRFPLTLDWDTGTPTRITVRSAPADNGRWQVDWGNGHTATATVTDRYFEATYDYHALRDTWVVVTNPAGKTARRRLRQIRPIFSNWTSDGSALAIYQHWERHSNQLGVLDECDPYSVLRVDAGDGRPLAQVHRPAMVCPDRAGNGFRYTAPGTYTVTVHGPMSHPVTHQHTVTAAPKTGGPAEFVIRDGTELPSPVTARFHVGDITDLPDRYTGWFTLANPTGDPQPVALGLTLREPAHLVQVDAWHGTATQRRIGPGRWRVEFDQPIPPHADTRLDITVDSAGVPTAWPTRFTVTRPTPGASPRRGD